MDKAYKFSNCLAPITVTIPRKNGRMPSTNMAFFVTPPIK